MASLVKAIQNAEEKARKRGWDRLYYLVDIHETIIEGNWSNVLPTQFYPGAIELLQNLTKRKDICLILWKSVACDCR